jgi:hypothetical protein
MMDESSVGMIFPFPSVSGKSNQIPWFQSPPTRYFSCSLIFYVISYITSLFIFYQKNPKKYVRLSPQQKSTPYNVGPPRYKMVYKPH